MALLSFRGISTPSLTAQGEQRRSSYFNIRRGDPIDPTDKDIHIANPTSLDSGISRQSLGSLARSKVISQ